MSVKFSEVKITHKLGEFTLNGGVEYMWDIEKSRLSSNMSLYLAIISPFYHIYRVIRACCLNTNEDRPIILEIE